MIRAAFLAFTLGSAALPAAVPWSQALRQPADWYAGAEARDIAVQVRAYQSAEGGWLKNWDLSQPPSDRYRALSESERAPTIDNGGTTTPLRFLAAVVTATTARAAERLEPGAADDAEADRRAVERGLDYLLKAQYPNGGWPQFFPLRRGYYTHITFNDDAMVRTMEVLDDVARRAAPFAWIDAGRRAQAKAAVERGVECMLKCQVVVAGRKTVWCAQHDEVTLQPAAARKFEPASLTAGESVGIVRFLMSRPDPSPAIVEAVEAAVAWFQIAQLKGWRWQRVPAPEAPRGIDAVVTPDASAPPLWARFYELTTNRPIFIGRDSVIHYAVKEIEHERRIGYAWYGTWPATLLERDYPQWRQRQVKAGRLTAHAAGTDSTASVWPVQVQPRAADAVVAADGTGDFKTLQEAISAAPARRAEEPRWVIRVKAGHYQERIYVQRERGHIRVVGEGAERTTLSFNLHAGLPGPDGQPIGTFRTPTVQIDGDGMQWQDLTLANTAGPVGQALALRVDGDRVEFRRCRFLGWQDTILLNRGRQYFEDCYIEGHVDFIFGGATAWFERCEVHCLRDGYITAASTPQGQPYGFVFARSRVTGADGVRTYLGRPWRVFAQTIFLETELSAVVRPEGWQNWGKPEAERTVFYAEFGNTGAGASPAGRVGWARQLTAEEASRLNPPTVLGGADGWRPGGS